MKQIPDNDIAVFVGTMMGLWFFYRVRQSFPQKGSFSGEYVKKTLTLLSVILIFSIFYYWKLRLADNVQPGFNTWFIGLDVVLAHVVVTLPIILILVFLFQKMIKNISLVGEILFPLIFMDLGDLLASYIVPGLIISLIGYLGIRFLLIDTVTLQLFLFGEFDPALGWHYPTTYTLSTLSSNLENKSWLNTSFKEVRKKVIKSDKIQK